MSGAQPVVYFVAVNADNTVLHAGHMNDANAPAIMASQGFVAITQADYDLIQDGGSYTMTHGTLARLPDPPPDMNLARAAAIDRLDASADLLRNKVMTGGSTMAMVYAAKARESDLVLAIAAAGGTLPSGPAMATTYPLLTAEIGHTAPTLLGVAQAIFVRARIVDAWLATTEAIRIPLKQALRRAASPADIQAALSSVTWPALPGP